MFWKSDFKGILLEGASSDNTHDKIVYYTHDVSITYSTVNLGKDKTVVMYATTTRGKTNH